MTQVGQLIAVKQVELPTSSLNDAQKVFEGLQREVDILKDMRHPNIVRYQNRKIKEPNNFNKNMGRNYFVKLHTG